MINDNSSEKTMEALQASLCRELSEKSTRLLDRWREAGSPNIGVEPDRAAEAWAIMDPAGRRIALAGCRADAAQQHQYGYGKDPYGAAFELSCCIPTSYPWGEPTVTPAEACAIANQIIAATCKHWDAVIEPSFCREEGLRAEDRADTVIDQFAAFELTWTSLAMPSGAPVCQLRASARRISATGSISALWPTPTVGDGSGGHVMRSSVTGKTADGRKINVSLGGVARHVAMHGTAPDGSTDPTANGAGLDPAFSCWLLGLPITIDACAPMATASSPRSAPRSSKRSSKRPTT
jgi:hypothetical protein